VRRITSAVFLISTINIINHCPSQQPHRRRNFLTSNTEKLPRRTRRELHLGHSISLCARAARAILNHTPMGEYKATLFPQETSACSCGQSDVENRFYVLTEYPRLAKDRVTLPSAWATSSLPIRLLLPSQHPGNLHTHDDHPMYPLRHQNEPARTRAKYMYSQLFAFHSFASMPSLFS